MAATVVEPGMKVSRFLADENEQERLGRVLARGCQGGALIFLHGDLGAGKTTLARGFIREKGHGGRVKSPTYTLVEPYRLNGDALYHVDLYRLTDPGELEFLGIREMLTGDNILLIEWPERARTELPAPDLVIALEVSGGGRQAELEARTAAGESMLAGFS